MQKTENRPGGRLYYLDLLRVIACLSVVMIHVSAEFVVRGNKGPDFWVGNLLDSLSRAGVPLFVMISGALMLDERYELTKKKLLGHIGRMAAFYLVWSTFYCWQFGGFGSVTGALKQIISGHYHLWFVPMIIGLYLIVPLLRLWVKEANVRCVEYFLLISAVFVFTAPLLAQVLGYAFGWVSAFKTPLGNMNFDYAAEYVAYFVLGWYLNRGVKHEKLICWLGILGAILTFAGTGLVATFVKVKGYPFYENATINVLMHSAAIFVFCRMRFSQPKKPGGVMHGIVKWIGRCSLGIYAVHIFVISQVMGFFDGMHCAAAMPLIFITTVVISCAASMILRLIPLVKKIV